MNRFDSTITRKCFFALAISAVLFGQTTFGAERKDAIDPHADEWLRRMGDYLGGSKFFSVNAEIWQDIQISSGQQIQAGRTITLQVRRPDRLRAEVHSPRRNRQLIYDGQQITLSDRLHNFYGSIRLSGSLDDAMDKAVERFGIEMPLEDFLRSDPYRDLIRDVQSGSDIGLVDVMGKQCEHLAFTQGNIDWQVWIETGARPVPRKFVITYKDEPGTPQFTAIFSKWDFNTPLPDFLFKFAPPPGATKIRVREMRGAVQSQHGQPQPQEAK
jgi:hypothetical protein